MEFTHAVIDLDPVKYAVASKGETRSIKAVHKISGNEYDLSTRTEFWGHYKKKAGGLLAKMNESLSDDNKMLPDDFEIIDIQTPEPLSFVLHTAKVYTQSILNDSGCETFHALMGTGDSWRVETSTLLKYKGNRDDFIKPYHYDDVVDYLTRKFNCEIVKGLEVDDRLVIDTYGRKGHFAIAKEKDIYSSAMYFYDTSNPDKGVQNGNQFGELYLNAKGDVKGIGRKHFMYQVCSQDDADNYKANCFSDLDWGSKSAYNALLSATNDKELFQAAVNVFKKLYPEPKTIKGWRGDDIDIDWLYVMQEMVNMAWMKRKLNEPLLNVSDILNKLGVDK